MRVVRFTSGVHEKTRAPRNFKPGDTVPEEYRASITNPAVIESTTNEQPRKTIPVSDLAEAQEYVREPETKSEQDEPTDPYDSMKTVELREILAGMGKPTYGRKDEMIQRLREG